MIFPGNIVRKYLYPTYKIHFHFHLVSHIAVNSPKLKPAHVGTYCIFLFIFSKHEIQFYANLFFPDSTFHYARVSTNQYIETALNKQIPKIGVYEFCNIKI